ncbi:phosphoribosyltransferase [Patescibacteria group bacterium]|nr:phosphoribosyltransferase [Patescibacteria group bacterium]MBU1885416.1 phosphoribosyltransferase [Patescibacteria group bacterium]
MRFVDRTQAGRQLANKLTSYQDTLAIVLALPRGGVPVGFELAQKLNLPLDVLLVRKIGTPGNPECGLGALTEEGVLILDEERLGSYEFTKTALAETIKQERVELRRRQHKYRPGRTLPNLKNKTVILVDDGIATGVTIRAAIKLLRDKLQASKIILAVPVCAVDTAVELEQLVDELVCLKFVSRLWAISLYYQEFEQTSDKQVIEFLAKSSHLE